MTPAELTAKHNKDLPQRLSRGEKNTQARLAAVQALYKMDLSGAGLEAIFAEFEAFWMGREIEGDIYKHAERGLFRSILSGVVAEQRMIDPKIDDLLANGWPLKRIEMVMRAILRAGAFEMIFSKDVPMKVVISEYADLTRAFFDESETGMVNAVLDRLAREMRPDEVAALHSK